MKFRTLLTLEDPHAIATLVRRAGVFSDDEIEIARSLAEETLARGQAAGYHFLIADAPRGIDAYTCFGPIPGTEQRYELYWIAVDPRVQRKGHARDLLAQTEHAARAMGARRLYAETSGRPAYRPAHGFYSRAGYRLVATIADYHADGDSLMIFEKIL